MVLKLGGRRTSYEAMRSLIVTATDRDIPSFDELRAGITICDLPLCSRMSNVLFDMSFSTPGCGGSSTARGGPDGADGLGEAKHVLQGEDHQQQLDRMDSAAPLMVALDAGLFPGGVKTAYGTAAGAELRYGSADASEFGLMSGQLGGGGGWAEQRGEESLAGAGLGNRRAGGGDGVVSKCGCLSLAPHQPPRDGPPSSPDDVGPGPGRTKEDDGSFRTGIAANVQHRHQHELRQDREARSMNDFPAASVLPWAPDDHQQVLSRSPPPAGPPVAAIAFEPANVHHPPKLGGYPRQCEAVQDGIVGRNSSDRAVTEGSIANRSSGRCVGPCHDLQSRSGAQPLSYGGGQRGDGGDNVGGGGPAEFSDLAGLLLDD